MMVDPALGLRRFVVWLFTIPADKRVTPGARGLFPLGVTVNMPATLPRRCSARRLAWLGCAPSMPATLPRRCSISAFCFCLTVSMDRTCSMAASSRPMVKPITAGDMTDGDIGVVLPPFASCDGARWMLVLSAWGPPVTVVRRFLEGGPRKPGMGDPVDPMSMDGRERVILDAGGGGGGGGLASGMSWSSSSLILTGDARLPYVRP